MDEVVFSWLHEGHHDERVVEGGAELVNLADGVFQFEVLRVIGYHADGLRFSR